MKGRVIKYKPVAKLSGKTSSKKGGQRGGENDIYIIVKCNSAENCKKLKEEIQKKGYTEPWIQSIEDLDNGKEFKINMYSERQEKDFRILYQTILETIPELSKKIGIQKAELASFGVYKKIGNSVHKFNLFTHEWNSPKKNEDPVLVSSN